MLIKRDRRGAIKLSLEFIIELFIIAVIAIAFFVKISDIASSDVFEKQYLSRDLGLLIDSVYAAPGSLVYSYSSFDNNFSASIKDNVISVSTHNKTGSAVRFPYVDDSKVATSFERDSFDNVSISFFKSKTSLHLSSKQYDSFDLKCSDAFSFKPSPINSILVDPSYSGDFPGKKSNKINESYVTLMLSRALAPLLNSESSRGSEEFLSVQRRISLSQGKDLSLTLLTSDSDSVDVFIRSDSLSDKRLACYLIKNLGDVLEKGSLKSINDLDESNKLFVFGSDAKVSVAVTVGSVDGFSSKNLNLIAERIDKSLEEYNE